MTFDDIVDLAEKAGCDVSAIDGREYQTMWCDSYQLERFAAALIQAGAASRDAYIEQLELALLQVRKAICGDIHNTDDLLDLIASRDAEVAELVRFIKEVAVSTSDHTTTDVIDEALAKVRKP